MSEPVREGKSRGRWRKRLSVLTSVLILAGAVTVMAVTLGPKGMRDVVDRLITAHPGFLLLAAGINLARYGLWALRWQLLMKPVAPTGWWPAFRALMVSVFLNTVVPAARPVGGIIRARLLSRSTKGPSGPIYGGALVDQFGYSLVSAAVGAICLPWAFLGPGGAGGGARRVPIWILAGVALLVAAVLIHPRGRRRVAGWMQRRLPRAAQTVQGALEAGRALLGRPATFLYMGVGGSVVWFANAIVLWVAGWATGTEFTLGAAAAAWAIGSFAGAVSGTPGGAGATEAAAILPLMSQGIPESEALAAVLLARGLHYVSAILIGGACFIFRPGGAGAPWREEPGR